MAIQDIISWPLILAGCFFILTGAFGLIRMPDIYTRMHATSVIDTLGAGLLFVGLMVQAGFTLVSLKLLIILFLFFLIGPVSSHAVAQVALRAGIKPQLKEDRTERLSGNNAGEGA